MKEGDEWKAAFQTNQGLFEPLVMFFGLCNNPATFQTMMDDIFNDLITEGVVVVYLDDILIFTETLEEHRKVTRRVMELLRKNNLFLKPEKCKFEKTEVEYLGVIISQNSVKMDPVKVAGVTEWPIPSNRKEMQSFLGFTNFYHRFIQGFSHTAGTGWCFPQKNPFLDMFCDFQRVFPTETQKVFLKEKSEKHIMCFFHVSHRYSHPPANDTVKL